MGVGNSFPEYMMTFQKLQSQRMRRQVWPSARDYCEAIVDPNLLGDFELRSSTLECNPGGLPKAYTGAFTTTFHFQTVSGGAAFRCYTRGHEDLERRYSAIAELLRYVSNDALCQTQYVAKGIRVGGTWWPAVKMDWVAGLALNAEIEARFDDGDAMLALATNFRETVRSLEVLGVAHGDLQHGNILVRHGRLHLIDYDAMFLPAIAGLAQTEYGHRNYQHPQRRTARFDGRLDRFSSIVIYTALVALSADPSLWPRFNDGENLLFRVHDFTSNGHSELFRALLANNATSGLADVLLAACQMPVEQVPTLELAIQSGAGTMPAPSPVAGREVLPRRPLVVQPVPPPRPDGPQPAPAPSSAPALQAPPQAPAFVAPRPARLNRFVHSTGLVVTALAAMAIGFGIVAWPHGAARRPLSHANRATVAIAKAAPSPLRTVIATAKPIAVAIPTATAVPTAAVTPAKGGADYSVLQGEWRIDEANLQDGRMVWSGDAVLASDGTMVLDAHKDSIAGRSATRCERQTNLHTAFALGVAQQTVPFRERNCEGKSLSGEVRVASFSPDDRSFFGSFWQGGVKLGDFTASKQ
jgi:hypothetical protein